MYGLDNVCQGCARRAVGCRSQCPDWAEHEARKAESYAARKLLASGSCVSQRREQSRRLYTKELKRGRCG